MRKTRPRTHVAVSFPESFPSMGFWFPFKVRSHLATSEEMETEEQNSSPPWHTRNPRCENEHQPHSNESSEPVLCVGSRPSFGVGKQATQRLEERLSGGCRRVWIPGEPGHRLRGLHGVFDVKEQFRRTSEEGREPCFSVITGFPGVV